MNQPWRGRTPHVFFMFLVLAPLNHHLNVVNTVGVGGVTFFFKILVVTVVVKSIYVEPKRNVYASHGTKRERPY